jgi:hypothetical protein
MLDMDRKQYPEAPQRPFVKRPKESKLYEWYNVLWVSWKDGIAYMKGIGRVQKDMWEAQGLEWIDLTLG